MHSASKAKLNGNRKTNVDTSLPPKTELNIHIHFPMSKASYFQTSFKRYNPLVVLKNSNLKDIPTLLCNFHCAAELTHGSTNRHATAAIANATEKGSANVRQCFSEDLTINVYMQNHLRKTKKAKLEISFKIISTTFKLA